MISEKKCTFSHFLRCNVMMLRRKKAIKLRCVTCKAVVFNTKLRRYFFFTRLFNSQEICQFFIYLSNFRFVFVCVCLFTTYLFKLNPFVTIKTWGIFFFEVYQSPNQRKELRCLHILLYYGTYQTRTSYISLCSRGLMQTSL